MSVANLKRVIKRFIPASFREQLRRRRRPGSSPVLLQQSASLPEWEFHDQWGTDKSDLRGWNVSSIANTQLEKWPAFLALIDGSGPLGVSHEAEAAAGCENLWAHNLVMSYAYCVTLASRSRNSFSLLDWGGGIGHYFELTKAVLPGVEVDYYCQDVPILCEAGRSVLPGEHFLEDPDACFRRTYDFVHAGSSLWYCQDWRKMAAKLVKATQGYLYITRQMYVNNAESYVAIQRPQKYGYDTEYQCWILNRSEFLQHMKALDVILEREFFFGPGPSIHGALEQATFRGFLFRTKG